MEQKPRFFLRPSTLLLEAVPEVIAKDPMPWEIDVAWLTGTSRAAGKVTCTHTYVYTYHVALPFESESLLAFPGIGDFGVFVR